MARTWLGDDGDGPARAGELQAAITIDVDEVEGEGGADLRR